MLQRSAVLCASHLRRVHGGVGHLTAAVAAAATIALTASGGMRMLSSSSSSTMTTTTMSMRLRMSSMRTAAAAPVATLAMASSSSSSSCFAAALRCQRGYASSLSSKNPYTVLGIKKTASKEQIKKAYRVMARKHHPDAPGGDHARFQEIQEAYEQIKSGVWIQRGGGDGGGAGGGGGGAGGDGGSANRYTGFRYTTRTHHKNKVSYDEFYTEMHTGKVKRRAFEDDDDEDGDASSEGAAAGHDGGAHGGRGGDDARRDPRRNPFLLNEIMFQAWLRFIIMWCVVFTTMRVGLFLLFPPKHERPVRKPPPGAARKPTRPPPPRPLPPSREAIIA